MPNYRRRYIPSGTYFFTVNLADRRATLLTDHIDTLRPAIQTVQASMPFVIEAAVVLPDHLHCIWTLPQGDANFSIRWNQIKGRFSRGLVPQQDETATASRTRRRERKVWQRRFWEHAIRNEDDMNAHIDYIHFNPVKHGLADRPIDWLHSSIHRFVRDGILDPHWGTSGAIDEYINAHNQAPKPFIWTASATDILAKTKRARRVFDKL